MCVWNQGLWNNLHWQKPNLTKPINSWMSTLRYQCSKLLKGSEERKLDTSSGEDRDWSCNPVNAVSSWEHLSEARGWLRWQWSSSPADARARIDMASSPTADWGETHMTGSFSHLLPLTTVAIWTYAITGWHAQSGTASALVYVDCNSFAALGVGKKMALSRYNTVVTWVTVFIIWKAKWKCPTNEKHWVLNRQEWWSLSSEHRCTIT